MGRSPSNFRQEDVQRVIKAAKRSGLDVVRVEVDPKTAKIVLVVKEDGNERKQVVTSLANAPSFWEGRKGRK